MSRKNLRPSTRTQSPIFMDDDATAAEAASAAAAHESDLASQETRENIAEVINLGKQLEAEREARKIAESRAAASEASNRRFLYQSQCRPTVIGGRNGIPPRDLDIQITTENIDGTSRQVAWIPVPLFPAPVARTGKNSHWTDARTGETHANLDLGVTQVRESLATAPCTSITTGATHTVSLTGYATISLHRDSADEIISRISNREHASDCETVTDDEDWDKLPFIPSKASPTPKS